MNAITFIGVGCMVLLVWVIGREIRSLIRWHKLFTGEKPF